MAKFKMVKSKIMEPKIFKLRIREADRDIFDAIKNGKKKIETRAATEKYKKIKIGDKVFFICGDDNFERQVKNVEIFKTINNLVKKYKPEQINPNVKTKEELIKMWHSFPNYREKIKKYGLAVWELK